MPETTYDVYKRRYTVEDPSQREPAEVEAETEMRDLVAQIRALKQELAIAEAALAEAEATT